MKLFLHVFWLAETEHLFWMGGSGSDWLFPPPVCCNKFFACVLIGWSYSVLAAFVWMSALRTPALWALVLLMALVCLLSGLIFGHLFSVIGSLFLQCVLFDSNVWPCMVFPWEHVPVTVYFSFIGLGVCFSLWPHLLIQIFLFLLGHQPCYFDV